MKNNFLITLSASLVIVLSIVLINGQGLIKTLDEGNACGCEPELSQGNTDILENIAYFENQQVSIPSEIYEEETHIVLGSTNQERWIEIDLSEQKLMAWEGNTMFIETKVSTGLPWTPTPVGEFNIWIKLRATKMEGGSGKYYYYLPNVPYVMFFQNEKVPGYKGYSLHGTYWHDDFGTQRSHGCVNLPTPVAKEIYYWTSPMLPEGKNVVNSTNENPGTRIVIHE